VTLQEGRRAYKTFSDFQRIMAGLLADMRQRKVSLFCRVFVVLCCIACAVFLQCMWRQSRSRPFKWLPYFHYQIYLLK